MKPWTAERGVEAIHGSPASRRRSTLGARGLRVVGRQQDEHVVVEQRHALEPVGGERREAVVVVAEREVERAVAQPRQQVLGLALGQREVDARPVAAEVRHGVGDERGGGAEGREPQPPAAQRGDPAHLRLGAVEPRRDLAPVLEQHAAGRGQRGGARRAGDEPDAESRLRAGAAARTARSRRS